MSESPIKVRQALDADLPFIFDSWLNALRPHGSAKHILLPVYRDGQRRLMRKLVFRSQTRVAYAAEVPDEILGYSVVEGDTCHFVYVKGPYRRMGIATGLVKGLKWYTHWTGAQGRLFTAHVGLTYNPYLTNREGLE
jgi:hypothetical protein